jgi:hypothetical protein
VGYEYATVHIQGNRNLRQFTYREEEHLYPNFVQALRVAQPNDRITVHSIVSNYYRPERMWKLERMPAGAIFSDNREEIWREVSERSAANAVEAKERTTLYAIAIVLFLFSEIYGFRKNGGDRIIGDKVVYKAAQDSYVYLAAAMVIAAGMMIYLGTLMISFAKIRDLDPSILLPMVGTLIFLGIGIALFRMSKTIKHDLVLTREGLNYPELLKKYGIEFIPWSNMLFCVPFRHGFYLHLKKPLNGEDACDAVYIDTDRLKGFNSPTTDIEHGIHGKLFPAD